MGRFIVRFRRDATGKDAIVERLHASPEVVVVEETARMVLVEANGEALRQLVPDSDDVVVVQERRYARPNPPLTVEKKHK